MSDQHAGARLTVEDLTVHYGSIQVLFGVGLHVDPGEMLALLGTNGAGKSTLLRAIVGLHSASSGQVILDGEDVTARSPVELVQRSVVLVEGGKAVFPDMTVEENLAIGAVTLRRDPTLMRERVDAVLEQFPGLRDRARQLAGSMSGGEQQQLALAKAFVLQPRLLLIDELSLGLAPIVVEALLESVRAINASGTSVVLVEQSLNVAASLCGRAVFMEKGAVQFEGQASELLERSDIARAVFLGTGR